jgi:hypothetical protein
VSEPELATICGQIRLTKQHVKFSDPVWKGPPLILTNINLKVYQFSSLLSLFLLY